MLNEGQLNEVVIKLPGTTNLTFGTFANVELVFCA